MSKWKPKYGLVRRLKRYMAVNTRQRTVSINPEDLETVPPPVKACLDKLIKQYGFNAQTYIS